MSVSCLVCKAMLAAVADEGGQGQEPAVGRILSHRLWKPLKDSAQVGTHCLSHTGFLIYISSCLSLFPYTPFHWVHTKNLNNTKDLLRTFTGKLSVHITSFQLFSTN